MQQKVTQKEYKTKHELGGKGEPLGIVQEIKVWPYGRYIHKPEFILENKMHKIFREFKIQLKWTTKS